jgi:hypothetical protein
MAKVDPEGWDWPSGSWQPPAVGASIDKPSAARIYDYLIGGNHNYAIDRAAASKIQQIIPRAGDYMIENRRFLQRAVAHACQLGYRQFIDIGSGLPSKGNVHEVADQARPSGDTRVVYVDNEPIAFSHAELLLAENADPSRHRAVHADLLDCERLWHQIRGTGVIDMNKPIVLLIVAVLHFIKDSRDPDAALAFYRNRLPPGSLLVMSTMTNERATSEAEAESLRQIVDFYEKTTNPGQLRTGEEFQRFFGDFAMLDPGLVYAPAWHPDGSGTLFERPELSRCLVGAAGKPVAPTSG